MVRADVGGSGSCRGFRASAAETAKRVTVHVERPICGGPETSDYRIPDPRTLNLKHPLDGRTVGGPQLVVHTRFNVQDGVGNHTQIPDLRGVRFWQARNIAKTFATTVSNHSGESTAYVTDQSPAPGSGPIDRIPPIQVHLSR